MIQTDSDLLQWILSIAEVSRKPACLRYRLFEIEIEIVQRAGMKHHATVTGVPFQAECKNRLSLGSELSVLNMLWKSLACALVTVEPALKTMKKAKGNFVPFIAKLRFLARITDHVRFEIPTIA